MESRHRNIIVTVVPMMLLVLLATLGSAETEQEENLYLADSLRLKLDVRGEAELVATGEQARVETLETELLLLPRDDFRQQVISLDTSGEVQPDRILFSHRNPAFGTQEFGYTALLETSNQWNEVRRKIPFPLSSVEGYEEYLLPTETIDSDNPAIIAKATELVEGEDDLFKVVFNLASWVEENVEYDLSTLTAETSQKASWVLHNKEGVCDEMTSLFIAMARAVGIPARFVSGISYTTSDLFTEPWQPHGWAEVYFPGVGWVSFDITFGEYGYIDVTHIKLRDGADPKEAATRYQWIGYNVDLNAGNLVMDVATVQTGSPEPDAVQLSLEVEAEEVDFSSYNVIKAAVKNNAGHYAASTITLATPPELEMSGRNKRTILLEPQQEKEIFWSVRVPEGLNGRYVYTFPLIVYTEKNVSVRSEFRARSGGLSLSGADAEQLTRVDEQKSYSRNVDFHCALLPERLLLNKSGTISCTVKNTGNSNLERLRFCIAESCHEFSLPINQQQTQSLEIRHEIPGWQKVLLSAENQLIDKKEVWEYMVVDAPLLQLDVDAPQEVEYGMPIELTLLLRRGSFSEPREIKIIAEGFGQRQEWETDALLQDLTIETSWPEKRLAAENQIVLSASWKDEEGNSFRHRQEIVITGKAGSFLNRLRMFWNKILNSV